MCRIRPKRQWADPRRPGSRQSKQVFPGRGARRAPRAYWPSFSECCAPLVTFPPLPTPGTMRVVSLLPAATEIVCALGAEAELVGVSHECDYPRGLTMRGVPALTRARIDLGGLGGSSLEIDRAVRRAAADALGIYLVDVELLSRVRPELIVTQDLCEVCAVSLDDSQSAVSRWV